MLTRFSIFVLATVASWYGMMLTHEAGHCLGALATGGTVQSVDLPLWGFSLTTYRDNPHPLFVAWAGPIGGALIALLVMASVIRFKGRWRNLLLYFCGFILIANGIYLGLGGFFQIGDCADLLRHGARLWQLLLFGMVATAWGGYCWHRLGPAGDWFNK